MTWIERSRPLKRSKPMARSRIKRGGLPRRVTRPGTGIDPAYLERVRGLACARPRPFLSSAAALCEGDTVAHHAGPKSNDSTAIPLCVGHHAQWHDGNGVFKGWLKGDRRAWSERLIDETRAALGWAAATTGDA